MSDVPELEINRKIAAEIAHQLDEKNPYALVQIERIIGQLGAAVARAFLTETQQVEAAGGMPTNDKKRRRSPGGVYFYLVRGRVSPEDRKIIFPYPRQRKKETSHPRPTVQPVTLNLEARRELLREGLRKPGEATNVKLTLIGRPAKILERNQFVVITMTGKEPPPLPKGLPSLPEDDPTVYLVYIAQKQWKRVSEAIKSPDDRLIIEGYPFNDKRLGVIGVLAQSTTTVKLQRSKQTEE
ncbi:MAG: hypothetical protein KA314_16165 [Chloroflexi bacterium]|nr:hypothetical protein [Chloroflexota bacterium]MBP8057370.1 hypothetical protein [Chloroflexota bacterium]